MFGRREREQKLSRSRRLAIIYRFPLPISNGACTISTPALRRLEIGDGDRWRLVFWGRLAKGTFAGKPGRVRVHQKYGKPVTVQNMYRLRPGLLHPNYHIHFLHPDSKPCLHPIAVSLILLYAPRSLTVSMEGLIVDHLQ